VKTVINFKLAGALLLLAMLAPRVGLADEVAAQQPHTVERLAAIVSYLVADYPGAVKDGRIFAQDEYAEQRGLLAEGAQIARDVAASAPADSAKQARLHDAFGAMQAVFRDKRSEADMASAGRGVHKLLLDEWGLVLTPTSAPSRERATELYAVACARCHGKDGHADTEDGRKLEPRPPSFFDDARFRRISPELAFHALTFGVNNTGMASFDTLPPSDRWSLAFLVVAMRHGGNAKHGAAVFTRLAPDAPQSVSRLAALTDDELAAVVRGATPAEVEDVLTYLRADAPFRLAPGGRFAVARARLAEVAAAADDHARARELAVAAYLEGIEPHEAALRAKDPALSLRLERSFLDLRQAIDAGAQGDALRREVARTSLVVDSVEERADGGSSVPFAAAFAIALREGFEISLLVAALLAFLRKSGREDEARYVHLGWMAAIPAGVVTWFVIGAALSGARRELTEGVLTLVAAAMLLFVSHFVLGKLESRRWLKFLERQTTAAGRMGWALFSVAFVAAFREAIEIVLFMKALLLDSTAGPWPVVMGAAAGASVLAVLVLVLGRFGRRLNPRPLMLVSSIVLTALAISLVGQGVRALQEGGYLALTSVPLPSLPALGVYATRQGLLAQIVVLVLVLVPVWLEKRNVAPTPRTA
jgi:high-affinity iron transporter